MTKHHCINLYFLVDLYEDYPGFLSLMGMTIFYSLYFAMAPSLIETN